jgi:hypothetical protein
MMALCKNGIIYSQNPIVIKFHFYEISEGMNFIETKGGMVIIRDWRKEGGKNCLMVSLSVFIVVAVTNM